MIDSRLILIEGMPSTGKTTNARLIQIQLERSHIDAKWIHEVAMPHPVLFFDEVGMTYDEYDRLKKAHPEASESLDRFARFRESTVGIHLPEIEWSDDSRIGEDAIRALMKYNTWNFPLDRYRKFALEKWTDFAQKALENPEEVYIIDSAIFQYQIFSFLFENRPYEELQSFVDRIVNIIRPLRPCLIYLYRENAEATIDYLEKDRGTSYLDYLWQRDKDQPYYADKPSGAESFKQFLRDYAGLADRLFAWFPARKRSLEISDGDWTRREDEMLAFLEVRRTPSPEALPRDGVYRNEALGFVIRVEGLSITDPTGKKRKLIPKSRTEFYVDWLPTVLCFEEERIVIAGQQICERWTTTGMIYGIARESA